MRGIDFHWGVEFQKEVVQVETSCSSWYVLYGVETDVGLSDKLSPDKNEKSA